MPVSGSPLGLLLLYGFFFFFFALGFSHMVFSLDVPGKLILTVYIYEILCLEKL